MRLIITQTAVAITNRATSVTMAPTRAEESDNPKFLLTPAMKSLVFIPNRMEIVVGKSMGIIDTNDHRKVHNNFHAMPETICLYVSFRKE